VDKADDFLDEKTRAQDILLGGLGFSEDAQIVSITITDSGYKGIGSWPDGEKFEFESDDPLGDLEKWALGVVIE